MYYTLAIVLERDVKNGSFWPSYVLCQSRTTSPHRTGWRIVKQFDGTSRFNLPKVLVTSIYGHEDMLDYFSVYRTQDKMHGVHYYPKGLLCWFESNQYGDPTGSIYIVRSVPDERFIFDTYRSSYKNYMRAKSKKITLKSILLKERNDTEILDAYKPRLHKWQKGE